MTAAPLLFDLPVAPSIPGIDLRCCDVAALFDEVRGARLVHADPPWTYDNAGCRGNAEDNYGVLDCAGIAAHLDAAWDCAADDAYLLCWTTWPKLMEWAEASRGSRWTYKSGGSWAKIGRLGVGFHWRGDSEPLLLYVKGNPRPLDHGISNSHISAREEHSEKPTPFLRRCLLGFTAPGDLVLDLYAGLAPMARACRMEGRQYLGAEIDPVRHAAAMSLLHRHTNG
jgi:hypothetical protein